MLMILVCWTIRADSSVSEKSEISGMDSEKCYNERPVPTDSKQQAKCEADYSLHRSRASAISDFFRLGVALPQ